MNAVSCIVVLLQPWWRGLGICHYTFKHGLFTAYFMSLVLYSCPHSMFKSTYSLRGTAV